MYSKLIKSFPRILINNPMGVTTKKKMAPITIGEINLPKKIPNLNHALFNGVKIFEFNRPKNKKINEITSDQIIKSLSFISGYKLINKKTIKKTIPKLRLDPNLISSFCVMLFL